MEVQINDNRLVAGHAGPIRVCIQGYEGAFHDIAARHCFDQRPVQVRPARTFEELVHLLEGTEEVDAALMAIENTLAGSIMTNYELLRCSRLLVVGETFLRIQQNLMALPGQRLADLTEVHSHPMAIAQCRAFFANYPDIRLIETEDTALSARIIKENGLKTIGAIASTLAAELYGLEILAHGIETNKNNHTRFLVLQRKDKAQPVHRANKVSISFSTAHEVGCLYKVLAVLAAYDINLSKIQSAPIIGQPWEYRFYVDFVTGNTVGIQQALDAIRPLTHELNIMGAYREGDHYEF